MTEIGTCPVCGQRFATFRLVRSGARVLFHHNDERMTRCEGAGQPPVDGSVAYQVTGRRITRETPPPDPGAS
jgi:hypothetical protein